MNTYKKIFMLFLGLPVLFAACPSVKNPSNRIQFYTLEYDFHPITDLKTLPVIIRMERFSVAPLYNTNRIIYRDRSYKRGAYVYHKWRVNPADLVTHFLSRDIRQSGLFKAVLPYDSSFASSYLLEGAVDEFFEWEMEEIWKAILSVNITLMAENEPDISQRIVFQKSYRAIKACKRKNPSALAAAMSKAMAQVSREIIKDIQYHLKDVNQDPWGSK